LAQTVLIGLCFNEYPLPSKSDRGADSQG